MKILVISGTGQIGWEVRRALAPLGDIVVAERSPESEYVLDLADAAGTRKALDTIRPEIIVNAAAYTDVDSAERSPEKAMLVNAAGPEILANWAADRDALLVHYSSDYVFDGSGSKPWRETDETAPLNEYGRSKLRGDRAIAASGCRYVILRTSWVYAPRGRNFLRTVLRMAKSNSVLRIVDDQFGTPTSAELIADITAHVLSALRNGRGAYGTYHATAEGFASWFEFAQKTVEALTAGDTAGIDRDIVVEPISSRDYPTPARRPKNSRLDTGLLRESFELSLPPWELGVERAISEIRDWTHQS